MEKTVKHNYDRQSDGVAESVFGEPRYKSSEEPKGKEDDFVSFKELKDEASPKRIGITVFIKSDPSRGMGRITFSADASELLKLSTENFLQFFYSKTRDEWVFCLANADSVDAIPVRVNKKDGPRAKNKRVIYLIGKIELARLLHKATGIDTKSPLFIPFNGEPDEKGRYSLITRLAKVTGWKKENED